MKTHVLGIVVCLFTPPQRWLAEISEALDLTDHDVNLLKGFKSVADWAGLFGIDFDRLPAGIKYVIIDVGWGGSSDFLHISKLESDVLLIGFEANPITWRQLGPSVMSCSNSFVKGCAVVLPFAIWELDGEPVSLVVSADGTMRTCDSLNFVNEANRTIEAGYKYPADSFEVLHMIGFLGCK